MSVLFFHKAFQMNLMLRLCVLGLVLFSLLACGEDKAVEPEPEPHPLVGTWQSSGTDITGFRNALLSFITDELTRNGVDSPAAVAENIVSSIADTMDGEFMTRLEIKENGTWLDTEGGTGTWKVQTGNTLIMTDVLANITTTYLYEIAGQRLTLSIRKTDFIELFKTTVEDAEDREMFRFFEAILSEIADSAEVMRWYFTKIS